MLRIRVGCVDIAVKVGVARNTQNCAVVGLGRVSDNNGF